MEINSAVWPKTVGEALDLIISSMPSDEKDEIAGMAEEDPHSPPSRFVEKTSGTIAGCGQATRNCFKPAKPAR
jgi:hypothetical protein